MIEDGFPPISRPAPVPGAANDTRQQPTIPGSFSGPRANAAAPAGANNATGTENAAPPAAATAPPGDPDKQKPALDLLPSVSLPKGSGAIRGMGEKFSVTAATGAASMSVPLPFSPGRAGFTPALGLSYDSGGGNGPFGFGWSTGAAAITRKTDKGLPQYEDSAESDVYILAGAQDLVPVLDTSGARKATTRTVYGRPYQISYYRPRVEAGFSRIERWTDTGTGMIHWRTFTRDNTCALYGYDPGSVVADPHEPAKIFSWHICRSFDDKGNLAVYTYIPENDTGIDAASAHEVNRTPTSRAAQIYLKTICYGNNQPYFADRKAAWGAQTDPPLPEETEWMFKVVFDYGDHNIAAPTPTHDQPWPVRPDPFSTYRPGFEVRTYRRVQRILFFNNFRDEQTAGADYLVRSVDLQYSDQHTPTDPRNPIYTMLVSATQTGHRQGPSGPVTRSLPPLEFTYSTPEFNSDVLTIDRDSLGNLPEGIDGTRFRWVDLDGEGCSGILTDAGGGWYYKRNLSPDNLTTQPDHTRVARARFGPLETVAALPSRSDLTGVKLLDLFGGGHLDVVDLTGSVPGFFHRTEDADFEPLQRFAALPQLDWADPNVKFIDVTGDGLADILITDTNVYTVHASLCGAAGFDTARFVRPGWDEEKGPAVILADGTQTIFTADMSGDGLTDIVRVRNGETCYWPNVGYGRFGAKVTMDNAPRFDDQARFDPARIRLADIDGTGAADLLYIGAQGVTAWYNQSGNAWSAPTTIGVFPTADRISSVEVLDLLGTGTACLVWSSPLPTEAAAPLLYVDLMGGHKPHLLTGVRNNLGGETRVTYAPSTRFYVADQQAGTPWITKLAFPTQVVERVETFDWIGRNRLVNRYTYHHGYYDLFEREFRGFGRVDQWDTEEFRTDTAFDGGDAVNWHQQSWSPPVLTRTWFHTGAFTQAPAVTLQYLSEYWMEPALRAAAQITDAQGAANAEQQGPAFMRIPDTVIPEELADAFEVQEAYRALKGQTLRVEVYAEDAPPDATPAQLARAATPYTVTEQNFTITCLQHRGPNLHAAFYTHPRESVSFHYERGTDDPRAGQDPRVGHDVVLEVDDYGNVKRSVFIGYPRRTGNSPPDSSLPTITQSISQQMLAYDQARLHIRGAEHGYTNPIDQPDPSKPNAFPDDYRTPLLASSLAAEITGVPAPSPKGSGAPVITDLYSYDEIDGTNGSTPPAGSRPPLWPTVWKTACDIPYEHIPGSDIDGTGTPATKPTRRALIQHAISYRSDDLTTLLAVGQLQPRAVPGQSYTAALTPGQLSAIFGTLVPATTLTEGGYVQLPASSNWWIPSGGLHYSPGDTDTPAQELAYALAHFFAPCRAVDPFGATAHVGYDTYTLLATSATDRVGNTTTAIPDYRVLAPATVTDPNGNRVAVAFDVLGMPTATAVMGETSQIGDQLTGFTTDLDAATLAAQFTDPLTDPATLLGEVTTRTIYDVDAYQRSAGSAQPAAPGAYTLSRETHVSDLTSPPYPGAPQTTRYQHHFTYGDGLGRQIQTKTLVAPGPLTDGGAPVPVRWVGSGWTILDNKGRPVRKYEPFFTATNGFEFAAQTGVSTVAFYDPPGRVVATLAPDNTWAKTVFDPWLTWSWDGDDTVLIADPTTDTDVGDHFTRFLAATATTFTSWYAQRIGGTFGTTAQDNTWQQDAAQKAKTAAATPTATHVDSLGRACLAVVDNGGGNRYPARTAYDTEGTPLAVFDALGRRAEEHCYRPQTGSSFTYLAGNDMAGNPVYHISADAGARRGLNNVAGQPIRSWDAREHAFRTLYDAAQRPTQRYVSTNGAPEILLDYAVYGEGQSDKNLCGRIFRHYDTAGYLENSAYDYKGNLLTSVRQLAVDYQQSPDWTPLAGLTTATQLDTAATTAGLIPTGDGGRDTFTATTSYDALNRPIQQIAAHNPTMKPDVRQPGYDQGAMLITLDAWLQQPAAPTTLLDPATADQHTLTGIDYNARGQRLQTTQGNGTTTTYTYDTLTFRLTQLTTTRPAPFATNQQTVQDLSYYYDAIGNITHIQDDADTQNVIFFNNQRVEPSASYSYDPLYRLVSATGREHLGQTGNALSAPQQVTNDDSLRMNLPQPGDGNAMGTYTETYSYDPVGNILTMAHTVSSGGWTRGYKYAEPSKIVTTETGNRLTATSLPGDPTGGPFSATYSHDPHGNMTQMPHLPGMTWDEDDRLRSTTRTVASGITPQTTFYCYDSSADRIRKTTNAQTPAGQKPLRASEQIYLGSLEIYREYETDGTTISLERETLHLNDDDKSAIALIETRTTGTDKYIADQVRYQYGNHLGSAVLELDDQANILTYEEYFPYGSTSYQAVTSQTELPKRYRYTGKERDDENDLYYHGARYLVPWLGIWISCDPLHATPSQSLYSYCRDDPVRRVDPDGREDRVAKLLTRVREAYESGTARIEKFAEVGDVAPYWKQGKARWLDPVKRIIRKTEAEHPLAGAALKYLNPAYAYSSAKTVIIPRAVAVAKTVGDVRLIKQVKRGAIDAAKFVQRSKANFARAIGTHWAQNAETTASTAIKDVKQAYKVSEEAANEALPKLAAAARTGQRGFAAVGAHAVFGVLSVKDFKRDIAARDYPSAVASGAGTAESALSIIASAARLIGVSTASMSLGTSVSGMTGGEALVAAPHVAGAFAVGAGIGVGLEKGSEYLSKKYLRIAVSPGRSIAENLTSLDPLGIIAEKINAWLTPTNH